MTIRKLFTKPVDRPIEGVIKADDARYLWTEVEEYVVTNEVRQRLDRLFETILRTSRTTACGSLASSAAVSHICSKCSRCCSKTVRSGSTREQRLPLEAR